MIRVAVFGGDGRSHLVEKATESCVVTAYEGDDSNAERVAQAVKRGTFTHVVVLSRWMNHGQWHKLNNVCKQEKVPFITWTRGLGELNKEIESWVPTVPTVPTAPTPAARTRCFRCGVEIAPMLDGHDDFVLCEKCVGEEKPMQAQETTSQGTESPFADITTQVREAFAIDPKREWTCKSLAEFLYDRTDNIALKKVSYACHMLRERGEIVHVGGVPKSRPNPERFLWAGEGAKKVSETSSKEKGVFPPNANDWKKQPNRKTHAERILEIFRANPVRAQTVDALVKEIFGDTKESSYSTVYKHVRRLAKSGAIRTVGERRFRNQSVQYVFDPFGTPPTAPAPAPTPSGEGAYAVIGAGEGFKIFASKAEAIERVRANPGARLFREVKLRVTVEIDE